MIKNTEEAKIYLLRCREIHRI